MEKKNGQSTFNNDLLDPDEPVSLESYRLRRRALVRPDAQLQRPLPPSLTPTEDRISNIAFGCLATTGVFGLAGAGVVVASERLREWLFQSIGRGLRLIFEGK